MKFNYQVRTKNGQIQSGAIEASSKEAAIALLQKHGLYVTVLESAQIVPVYAKKIEVFNRVSRKDLVMFSRQLSIMFNSKVPLVESLRVISNQTKNTEFQELVSKLSEEVEGGTSLSKALALYPEVFTSFYVAMVRAGEIAGSLSESLKYLADYLEREYALNSKIRGAMLYPALVMVVAGLVLGLMIFFVIPQLGEVLMQSQEDIPLATSIVIIGSAFIRKWILLIVLIILFLLIILFRYYQSPEGRIFFGKLLLRMPLIGLFLHHLYLSRFADNLSTLITGGLPISSALENVAPIIGNDSYEKAVLAARDGVKRGETISSILKEWPDIFPPIFIQMMVVGEKTGSLDTSLKNISDFYKQEINRSIDNFLSILEPALIVLLGGVVGGLMMTILLPLYQMLSF